MSVLDDLSALHMVLDEIAVMSIPVLGSKNDLDQAREFAIREKSGAIDLDPEWRSWITQKIIHWARQFDDLRLSFVALGKVYQKPVPDLLKASGSAAPIQVNGVEAFPHDVVRALGNAAAELLHTCVAQFPIDVIYSALGEGHPSFRLVDISKKIPHKSASASRPRLAHLIDYKNTPHQSAILFRRRVACTRCQEWSGFRGMTESALRSKLKMQFGHATGLWLSSQLHANEAVPPERERPILDNEDIRVLQVAMELGACTHSVKSNTVYAKAFPNAGDMPRSMRDRLRSHGLIKTKSGVGFMLTEKGEKTATK